MNNVTLAIQEKIKDCLVAARKSIAICAAPGMGLTTILSNLALEIEDKRFVPVDSKTLLDLWQKYHERLDERRFVIHEATVLALAEFYPLVTISNETDSINLVSFLRNTEYAKETFIVIDNFDDLPDELSVVVLDEIKFFEDNKSQEQYSSLKCIHYLIGGYIDFNAIYKGKYRRGVSPATNFEQFYPADFILTEDDVSQLLLAYFPDIDRDKLLSHFVKEWCGGYLYYVMEFCKWIISVGNPNGDLFIHQLMLKQKKLVEEKREVALYRYCLDAWDKVKGDSLSIELLKVALGSGYVTCDSNQARVLASLGFLIQKDTNKEDEYHIPNNLIALFVRQRLAELELVMPVADGGGWVLKDLNLQAYSLLVEMENALRSYVGDKLIYSLSSDTIDEALDELSELLDNNQKQMLLKIKGMAEERRKEENLIFDTGIKDCILSYLDFSALGQILTLKQDIFPVGLSELLSKSIGRLTSLRNRIAHNRPITKPQIDSLRNEWNTMQRIMSMKDF